MTSSSIRDSGSTSLDQSQYPSNVHTWYLWIVAGVSKSIQRHHTPFKGPFPLAEGGELHLWALTSLGTWSYSSAWCWCRSVEPVEKTSAVHRQNHSGDNRHHLEVSGGLKPIMVQQNIETGGGTVVLLSSSSSSGFVSNCLFTLNVGLTLAFHFNLITCVTMKVRPRIYNRLHLLSARPTCII